MVCGKQTRHTVECWRWLVLGYELQSLIVFENEIDIFVLAARKGVYVVPVWFDSAVAATSLS